MPPMWRMSMILNNHSILTEEVHAVRKQQNCIERLVEEVIELGLQNSKKDNRIMLLKNRFGDLEQYSRLNDIIVTGLEPKPCTYARALTTLNGGETSEQDATSVEQQVTVFLHSKGIELDSVNIEACHPLPRRSKTDKHHNSVCQQEPQNGTAETGKMNEGSDMYMNEILTKKKADIARKARFLGKQKKIQSTWMTNCKICIKLNGTPEQAKYYSLGTWMNWIHTNTIHHNKEMYRQQSLNFGVMVRDMLRKERHLINNSPQQVEILSTMPPSPSQEPAPEAPKTSDVDRLVYQVLYVQDCRQSIHQQQEDLNWDKQNLETIGPSIQNGMDPQNTELQKLQNKIQKQEHNLKSLRTNRLGQLKNAVESLGHCQARLISQLKAWSWEQHKATIGHPFNDNLGPLQTWCEQLLGLNGKLRQEWMLAGNPIPELQDMLVTLQQELIKSSLLVDKQPPQVIKTQSKFSTVVRYLLGEKMAPGKPVVLKAQIITEAQARHLKQLGALTSDNVGELINNTAILEHHPTSKSTCATFRNMSVKKIKRADRKGTESVTEEKFAILFSTDINITGCDTPYRIQIISVPVVVIVHGSQEINAMATVIWDCAFSEPDRIPFVVPDGVPWKLMCMTLNSKFMSEVQTQHCLNQYNLHFLAQKIFDQPDISGEFGKMMVSWAQFNKEMLPSRQFTFWQWFEGAMELTKRHLKAYWSEGVIFGFIGKQHLHLILKDRPNGTFLLRFSDSEIGGITIAYVAASENGGQKIQNIQPFSKRDLEIRCLGNRIIDIESLAFLYPDYPKHGIFEKYYTDDPLPSREGGYIGVRLQTKVDAEVAPASSNLPCNTPRSEMPDMSPRRLVQPLTSPLQPFPGNSFGADSSGGAAGFNFIDPIGIYPPEMPPPTNMDVDYDFIEKLIQE